MSVRLLSSNCRVPSGGKLHFPPKGDAQHQADRYESQIRDAITAATAADQWLSANPSEVAKYQQGDPFAINPDDDFAQVTLGAIADTFGKPVVPAGAPYGCDARLLNLSGGMPTAIFGPGSIEQAHAADEFLDVEQCLGAVKAMAALMLNWTR